MGLGKLSSRLRRSSRLALHVGVRELDNAEEAKLHHPELTSFDQARVNRDLASRSPRHPRSAEQSSSVSP